MKTFQITQPDQTLKDALQNKIDQKTKPQGALGQLEEVALQIGLIQNSTEPEIISPSLAVFAGDHGIATTGVSPWPQEVTKQMVLNFLQGGAAINVFAKQHQLKLYVIDAGVNADLAFHPDLIKQKIGYGTENMLEKPAMSLENCHKAIEAGAAVTDKLFQQGSNLIGFGEMGIGNTSAAALLMSHFCSIPLADCVGSGTGLDEEGIHKKLEILEAVQEKHQSGLYSSLDALATFGGYEIAMMCGAMLQAAENKMILLIDGFISSSALLAAHALYPEVLDYCVFSHLSNEKGHRKMLSHFGKSPLLQLDLRLGEGSGAALAFPLVQAAVNFLNQMASFESASVSQKS